MKDEEENTTEIKENTHKKNYSSSCSIHKQNRTTSSYSGQNEADHFNTFERKIEVLWIHDI